MRRSLSAAAVIIVALGSISTWLFAAERRGVPPPGTYAAVPVPDWPLSEASATELRLDALRRAAVRIPPRPLREIAEAATDPLTCRFLREEPSGTSAKFTCVLPDGEMVKVKYGRNPEIHAEVAATRLLAALGFAADEVTLVPRLRCYGCPRFPFLTMQLLWLASSTDWLALHGLDGFSEFEWVSVERKFAAPAIEDAETKGWAWWEIERSTIPRAELDSLRLVAVFLAHWDNKSENQRLVCLDALPSELDRPCARPLAMIQDAGSTFGPMKMNVSRWHEMPVWADRQRCTVSMRAMPFDGATFPDAQISEAGRVQTVRLFESLDGAAVRRLFAGARFPQFYSATDDERDLNAWVAAFRHRVDQLSIAGPCPTA